MKRVRTNKNGAADRPRALLIAAALALAVSPARADVSQVQSQYASAVQANCDQFSSVVKGIYLADVAKAQNNQVALVDQAKLGANCLTTIENAINSAIPAATLSLGSLVTSLVSQVASAVIGAACNVVYQQVNSAGQLINSPITQAIGTVNGTFTGAINQAVSSATGGVVSSTGVQGPLQQSGTVNLTNGSPTSPIQIQGGQLQPGAANGSGSNSSLSSSLSSFWDSMTCSIFHSC